MTKKISAAILLTLFAFSLFSAPVFALDKKPDPKDRPLRCKDPFPTHMTIEEATEYERMVGDKSEFADMAESDASFVPGAPASQGVLLGPSGLFNGIFAGNTRYDYQHNGICQRMTETGINPDDGIRYAHVTWMCLKVEIISDPTRQVNYNVYDPTDGPEGNWQLGADDWGGIRLTSLEPPERGGYTCLDVNSSGNAVVFHHSAVEGAGNFPLVARFSVPGMGFFTSDPGPTNLPGEENIWVRGEVGKDPTTCTVGEITSNIGDIYHCGAQDSGPGAGDPAHQAYWRFVYVGTCPTGSYVWEGPVIFDSVLTLSHLVIADGDRVVFAMAKPRTYDPGERNQFDNDLIYYESTTGGADWIASGPGIWESGAGFNCTDYVAADPHRVYVDITGGFDNAGRLHLAYNNPGYDDEEGTISTGPCALLHWDEGTPGSNENAFVSPGPGLGFEGGSEVNFSSVQRAMWGTAGQGEGNCGTSGAWNRYIGKMCIGFGDGTTDCYTGTPNESDNLDFVYITYTQFGSQDPLDKEDCSAGQQQNANIWVSMSNDNGLSWAAGKCITTEDGSVGGTPTRSPGCDPTTGAPEDRCRAEHWSSCATAITDTLHVFYVGDLDAGAIPYGSGSWQINDVMYLRVPGGTDGDLCPTIAPVLGVAITSDMECEFYSDLDEPVNNEVFSVDNFGNATLTFSVDISYTSGTDWMTLDGSQTIPSTDIVKGGGTEDYAVVMDGTDFPKGLYQAQINIHHNAATPLVPDPLVMPIDFFRADSFICGRGVVVHTPCVALEVSNTESFGRENGAGGMRYYNAVDDDSLFNPIFDGSLAIVNKTLTGGEDTVVYRDIFSNQTPSNPGFRGLEYPRLFYNAATNESVVEANQVTVDSTIGITVRYLFPQDADSCEFVRIKFKIYPYDNTDPNLIVGAVTDIDCPGSNQGDIANGMGSENFGGCVENYNLVYQHGTDTTRNGAFDRVTNRYVSGITALTCDPVKRMAVGSNVDDVYPVSGFTDGYLFQQMDASGCEIWADSAEDIHSIMSINEITLDEGDVYVYQFAVVTSIAGEEGVTLTNMPADITDLMETVKKAWKKGFGWCDPWWWLYGETVLDGGNGTIGFRATGTHEDGLSSQCCGCDFSYEITGTPGGTITVTNNGDCTGEIVFADVAVGQYTLTLIVADKCAHQTDEIVVAIESIEPTCDCGPGDWGDVNADGQVNPQDVTFIQQYVFFQNDMRTQHPNCPKEVGDVNCDGQVNPQDVTFIQQYVFFQNDMRCAKPCP